MAILRKDQTVLMCHRHPKRDWVPNVWDFPGGHISKDETPQQALCRELDEELGVQIAMPSRPPDAILEFESESTRLQVWIIDYGGRVENCAPHEHDELRWVSFREATGLRLADPGYVSLIDRALRL